MGGPNAAHRLRRSEPSAPSAAHRLRYAASVTSGQAVGMTRPEALLRAFSNRAWTSAQFTMFQIAFT